MKKLKLLFLLVFVSALFSSFEAKSQAEVVFDKVIIFYDGDGGEFPSIDSKTTLTPSGNIIITASFQLPEGHFLIPEKWKKYIGTKITTVDIMGNEVKMYDYNVAINSSGEFKIIYHSNGAGTRFPQAFE